MQMLAKTLAGAALALLPCGPAAAESASPWVDLQDARVRLLAASDGLDAEGRATLGLQVRLAEGWKTYWREPGEAGLPPRLDWAASDNLADAALDFPAPQRFDSFGFTSLGYAGEVVFPLQVAAADPARPLRARLGVDFMVCEAICVPMRADLALDLPPGATGSTDHAGIIAHHAAAVPRQPEAAGLRIERVAVEDGRLRVEARAEAPFAAPDLFVEADGRVGFGAPAVVLADGGRRAVLHLPVSGDLAGQRIGLTLVDGARAIAQAWSLP